MKTKLLNLGILSFIACISASVYGQDTVLNDFEPGSPAVTASYGAEFAIIANPVPTGNPSANCGQIKRTSGNWYELIRFDAAFSVPANTKKYIHLLVRYTTAEAPNMSVRVDSVDGNDGSVDIHPINTYITPGTWQDMVFEIPGGDAGINPTQVLFFADASIKALNNTDSFALIDQVVLNGSDTPIGYEPKDMMLNDFEPSSPVVTASYGAEFANVPNPLAKGNPTANVGEIKRTGTNWYELIRFGTYFNIPANKTRYIHVLAKYTSATVPNMSLRVDAKADNDGNVEIHPTAEYTSVGKWQDMVFAIPGGETGMSATQIVFFADTSVNVLNNTDSFAYIDEIMINDTETATDLKTNGFEQNNAVMVYPNPAKDSWNFESADGSIFSSIQITDILGKTVMTRKAVSGKVNINASDLSKGMYFATVTSGAAVQTFKVIKE